MFWNPPTWDLSINNDKVACIQKIMGSEDQMYVELKMIKNYDPKQKLNLQNLICRRYFLVRHLL